MYSCPLTSRSRCAPEMRTLCRTDWTGNASGGLPLSRIAPTASEGLPPSPDPWLSPNDLGRPFGPAGL
eukprot:scaffold18369_cov111-Isochrysis_galbana.AAC.3